MEHDPELLQTLREQTTKLANAVTRRHDEEGEKAELKRRRLACGKSLIERHDALFKEINHLAAILWNARFPKYTVPDDFLFYEWCPRTSGNLHFSGEEWDGIPSELRYTRDVWVTQKTPDVPGLSAREREQPFYLTTEEYCRIGSFSMWYDDRWCFSHRRGWMYIDGGVRSKTDFVKTISARLEALKEKPQ